MIAWRVKKFYLLGYKHDYIKFQINKFENVLPPKLGFWVLNYQNYDWNFLYRLLDVDMTKLMFSWKSSYEFSVCHQKKGKDIK